MDACDIINWDRSYFVSVQRSSDPLRTIKIHFFVLSDLDSVCAGQELITFYFSQQYFQNPKYFDNDTVSKR